MAYNANLDIAANSFIDTISGFRLMVQRKGVPVRYLEWKPIPSSLKSLLDGANGVIITRHRSLDNSYYRGLVVRCLLDGKRSVILGGLYRREKLRSLLVNSTVSPARPD